MRISHLDLYVGRYVVATDTPDGGRSTWAECWGKGHSHDKRACYATDDLADAVAHLADRHHVVVDRRTGRVVGARRIAAAQKA